jgi:hypothetical protein
MMITKFITYQTSPNHRLVTRHNQLSILVRIGIKCNQQFFEMERDTNY